VIVALGLVLARMIVAFGFVLAPIVMASALVIASLAAAMVGLLALFRLGIQQAVKTERPAKERCREGSNGGTAR
jgi:hypothetical protein